MCFLSLVVTGLSIGVNQKPQPSATCSCLLLLSYLNFHQKENKTWPPHKGHFVIQAMPEHATSPHACGISVLCVVVQDKGRTNTFPVNACCHVISEYHQNFQGSFSCMAIHSEVTRWQRSDACIGSKNSLFWVFAFNWNMEAVGKRSPPGSLTPLTGSSELCKDFMRQEWK